jgi:DNA-binding IclR family transcriptional regulator
VQRTIDRITRLLDALGQGRSQGATALAAATGVPAASCSRLLKGLVQAGWVDQDGNRGDYRLGPRLYALAEARPYQAGLLAALMPRLRELVARHPGSGAVVVGLRPWQRVGLWGCGDGRSVEGRMDLQAEPVWRGASGRLLIALLGVRQRRRWIAQIGLPQPGDWPGLVSVGELEAALTEIRRAGHAVAAQPNGMVAVAVPMRIAGGGVVALGGYHRGTRPAPWLLSGLQAIARG